MYGRVANCLPNGLYPLDIAFQPLFWPPVTAFATALETPFAPVAPQAHPAEGWGLEVEFQWPRRNLQQNRFSVLHLHVVWREGTGGGCMLRVQKACCLRCIRPELQGRSVLVVFLVRLVPGVGRAAPWVRTRACHSNFMAGRFGWQPGLSLSGAQTPEPA